MATYSTKLILTDEPDAELIYTAKIETTTLFTPLFVSAVAWGIAIELNMALSRGLSDSALRASFDLDLRRAGASNMNEGQPDRPNDGGFARDYQ